MSFDRCNAKGKDKPVSSSVGLSCLNPCLLVRVCESKTLQRKMPAKQLQQLQKGGQQHNEFFGLILGVLAWLQGSKALQKFGLQRALRSGVSIPQVSADSWTAPERAAHWVAHSGQGAQPSSGTSTHQGGVRRVLW